MSEERKTEDVKAVQTDRESQEYGAEHGQDVAGNETGSSSPVAGDAPRDSGGQARGAGAATEE